MFKLSVTCVMCGKDFEVEMTGSEYTQYVSGLRKIQDIFPSKSVMYREALVSRMCYDCLSGMYNIPKPDEDWGEVIGHCENCGCAIYGKDDGLCPKCGGGCE